MRAEDRIRVRHMVEACEAAIRFVAGRQRNDLDNDEMLLFAVVRAVEIIGEAASKVTEEVCTTHGDIPWRAIIGMRNRLIHAYFEINAQTVWETATVEIPALLPRLRALAEAQ